MRILLAEDNAANRMIARAVLLREGHEVVCAQDGVEAIDRARDCVPEVVLLDILMPVMHGVAASRHLRQILHDVPIIALTGYNSPSDVQRFLEAGFDGLIAKPLQPGDLDTVLARLGRGSRAVLRKARSCVADARELPLLDWRVIEDGPGTATPPAAERILARYRRTLWDAIDALRGALPGCLLAEPDATARFRNALHQLKGSSDMIGLARAPYLAGQLRNAPPSELREGVRALLEAISESLPVLHDVLLSPPARYAPPRSAELFALGQGRSLVEVGREHQPEPAHHDQHDGAPI